MNFLLIYCSENQNIATKFASDLASTGARFELLAADQGMNIISLIQISEPMILLVTDNFLRNKNCVTNAYNNYGQLIKTGRLLVIVADGTRLMPDGKIEIVPTRIERVGQVIQYMNYWQQAFLDARPSYNNGTMSEEEYNIYKQISGEIGDFARQLRDANFQYYENITARNYQQFCQMAGLPMPSEVIESAPATSDSTDSVANIVQNSIVEIAEETLIIPSSINQEENNVVMESEVEATIPLIELMENKTEEDEIENILANIPGLGLLENRPATPTVQNTVKTIDEDDFFGEKPIATIEGTNMAEIINSIEKEENGDDDEDTAKQIVAPAHDIEIEDIFEDEDAEQDDETDDIFSQITIVPTTQAGQIASENSIQTPENQPITSMPSAAQPIDTEEEEEELFSILAEAEEKETSETETTINIIAENVPVTAIEPIESTENNAPASDEVPTESINEIIEDLDDTADEDEEQHEEITDTIEGRLQSAWSAAQRRDYQGASAILEKVLVESPDNPLAYLLLGDIAKENTDYMSALTYYEKVAAISPYFPSIYQKMAQLSVERFPEDTKTAKKYFKRAIDLDEDNVELLYQYAEFLNEKMENPEKAIKYFKRVLKREEEHPFANYDLAMIYYKVGDFSNANEYYRLACSINPELATPKNDEVFTNYRILDVNRAGEAINLHNIEEDSMMLPIFMADNAENGNFEDEHENEYEDEELESYDDKQEEENSSSFEDDDKIALPTAVIEETEHQTSIEPQTVIAGIAAAATTTSTINLSDKNKPIDDAKIVLITGATAGIGRASAELFARKGYNLILTGRREDKLLEIQASFHEKYEGGCTILAFDLQNAAATQASFEGLDVAWQKIDVLINNAGLALGLEGIHEGKIEQWDAMIDTNIKGLLYMTRLVSPQMVERRRGQIINLCSTAGKEAYPNGNVYCATKFAVEALTRSMRMDLHKFGIRVGQVSPGAVEETEFSMVRFEGDSERAAKTYENFVPLRAADVADIILYVVSAPNHVNIQDVLVMGTQQASAMVIDRSGR